MSVPPRIERVDQHDVQIAGQPAVLESVIEQQDLRVCAVASLGGRGDAIGRLQVDHVGTELIQDELLIIGGMAASSSDRYPRLNMTGRTPRDVNHSARAATIGVLPVPPAVRFPMLMTGTAARCVRKRPQSNARLRRRTAAP